MDRFAIQFERRPDGGLRVRSHDIPGLILSGPEPHKILSDLSTALAVLNVLPPPPQKDTGE